MAKRKQPRRRTLTCHRAPAPTTDGRFLGRRYAGEEIMVLDVVRIAGGLRVPFGYDVSSWMPVSAVRSWYGPEPVYRAAKPRR